MNTIKNLPFFLLMLGISSLSAMVPATYALMIEEFHDARSFFYGGLIGLIMTAMFGIALATRPHNGSALSQLVALLAGFALLPVLLAVPFQEAVRNTSFTSAYFEMVSAMTTTGATLFDPSRLSGPEHLWRAQVGWMGGLLMWVSASAILAPLALGGFEVTAVGAPGQTLIQGGGRGEKNDPAARLLRSTQVLFPIYTGLTLALCVMLLVAGDPPLVALSHAMSTMATSGISPLGGVQGSPSGMPGEMIVFCFLFFALSRLTFSADTGHKTRNGLLFDPEFRMGLVIVLIIPALLFLRHWVASFEVGEEQNLLAGFRALWGSLFTAMSFLTTTGFVSGDWGAAQGWSGLSTPGIILIALAIFGGGVATTAGGVKLLRVFALYVNGAREIEKLVHPSSVGSSGPVMRRIQRKGAFIAWVFFMLFAVTLAILTMIFGLYGLDFESSVVLTVASLSNTGPLISAAPSIPIDLIALPPSAKLVLSGAMVLGRLELLAIIVMISPDIWRG
ncbi:TrkH family potassium uptake protein [Pelagimonas varians]|uniref:Trk system potassium uptake protein TrkG n=1 Tax=Pelagimonas varians TaxID=696760 RepID=A0A238JW96_9RHOB|nr:potassium transporter TrkG [Pelagimonas varians]PYG34463.1 trk system potassium uptake protein TrkH [Pelagimonas varians]SMX33996.1 Trk system potassium uptake protein TrkG [Pelagimonas varians]